MEGSAQFARAVERVLTDEAYRMRLQEQPAEALTEMGIQVDDPDALMRLRDRLHASNEVLLEDANGKKVFAVVTSAGIIVAASTPAFPKGSEPEERLVGTR